LRERIENNPSPEALRAATTGTAKMLDEYSRVRTELVELEGAEVQNILTMLNQTISVLSGGSERSVARLRQVEDDLKSAAAISDIVALKDRLRETLRFVREQSVREREESRRTVLEIGRDAQRVQERFAIARSGVPGRSQAEQAFAKALESPSKGLLVLVVLDRAVAIRERFGGAVGERFVHLFVQDLTDHLPPHRNLFRWTENSLVSELEPAASLEVTRVMLRTSLARIPSERKLDVGQRLAVFSNQHRWSVASLEESHDASELAAKLDRLVNV
jgi:hypothetical protein